MKYMTYRVSDYLTNDENNWSDLCNNINKPEKNSFMDTQLDMEERLWDYIDGLSSINEKSAIEKLIGANLEWKNKYHELLEAHQLMMGSELQEPSMRFAKNVMEEIAKYHVAPATRTYINKRVIWGIGGFFIILIIGFLVYALSQVNYAGASTPKILSEYNNTVNKLDWGRFFNSTYTTVFMMINVVLGLMMLDIYLTRKKQQHKEA
ncbi:MAG: hypothetical protein JST47_01125 [Bacteroidetes bacterium]|nr:hypothetical protein [Bacteroidota bacterium]